MAGVDDVNEEIPEDGTVDQNLNEVNTKDSDSVAQSQDQSTNERQFRLPLSRIKCIMKSDPEVSLASQEAVVALGKATELFIGMISKDASYSTMQSKRKTLQRKDLDTVLDTRDAYAFLEGTLD